MANNQDQIEFWNGEAAVSWVAQQQIMDAMLTPISQALLAQVDGQAGERALDVGCGCGDTSVQLAHQGVTVTGVDVSTAMLEHARTRITAQHSLRFLEGDAAVESFTEEYDVVLSRFGVMFFDDPVAAFANLRSALRPSGRLCFVCWQAPKLNPWIAVPMAAARPFLPPPADPVDPEAPGPFAFADAQRVTAILERAGFAKVEVEPLLCELHIGVDLEAAMTFIERIGPMSRMLLELDDQQRASARQAVKKALAPHASESGVGLDAACWLVGAAAS